MTIVVALFEVVLSSVAAFKEITTKSFASQLWRSAGGYPLQLETGIKRVNQSRSQKEKAP